MPAAEHSPPYPEGAPLLFSFHLAAAARRQALNAGAGCDGSECCLMQMPQLVGVPHHIDCRDLSVLDVECSRLKFAVGLHGDESRQSVTKPVRTSFEPFFRKRSARVSWTFMTASKPMIGCMAAGRLPPPSDIVVAQILSRSSSASGDQRAARPASAIYRFFCRMKSPILDFFPVPHRASGCPCRFPRAMHAAFRHERVVSARSVPDPRRAGAPLRQ